MTLLYMLHRTQCHKGIINYFDSGVYRYGGRPACAGRTGGDICTAAVGHLTPPLTGLDTPPRVDALAEGYGGELSRHMGDTSRRNSRSRLEMQTPGQDECQVS